MHPYAAFSFLAFQAVLAPVLVILRRLAKKDPERYRSTLIAGYVVQLLTLVSAIDVALGIFSIDKKWGDW
jgi:hypothetical protein